MSSRPISLHSVCHFPYINKLEQCALDQRPTQILQMAEPNGQLFGNADEPDRDA
jgi:hypothetical protein